MKKEAHKYYPEEILAAVLMALMVALCFINIVARYLFRVSMVFTDQLLIEIWPCVIFIGAPVCCSRRSLTSFTLISDKFSKENQKWFELITAIAGILSFGFLAYYGALKCYASLAAHVTLPSLAGCPVWIFYLPIPVGSVLYIVRCIQLCYKAFKYGLDDEEGNLS